MRTGLSTIQQTLTPEAASVLSHSIAEAGRRNHGQTTPLHVAAALLSSRSGFLRQACIRSHPNSSHPLQCRALELCFSVALDRIPTAATAAVEPPPISNALMAALKRAQAHQRRGCPEQQQQPLLAVKVELEQLIMSILDDPSVSRVMREASFSSPAVKATIEQSLNSPANSVNPSKIGLGFPSNPSPIALPNRNLYLNPKLQQQGNSNSGQSGQQRNEGLNRNFYLNPRLQQGNSGSVQSGQNRNEEVKRVMDILLRTKKRNPVLIGDSEPEAVMKELLRKIDNGEFGDGLSKNVEVIQLWREFNSDKSQVPMKIKELGSLIKNRNFNEGGVNVILDLGNLKWLVEQPVGGGGSGQQVVSETGRLVVEEMGKLVAESGGEGGNGKIWLIGTATCETYLRCQVYHPSMEKDWDLQAVPMASKSPLPGMFPRLGDNGIISNLAESISPLKSFPTATTALPRRVSENLDPTRRMSCCPKCTENYEKELSKLSTTESEKSGSEAKTEATRPSLPQWLKEAKVHNNDNKATDNPKTKDEEMIIKQKTQELQKKWSDTCMNLHPNFHHNLSSVRITPTPLSMTGLYNPNPLLRQTIQPKLQQPKNIGQALQLYPNSGTNRPSSPPRSPVRTELVLGQTKIRETSPEKTHEERVKDLLGCISSEPQTKFNEWKIEKFSKLSDVDEFKKLLKGLTEKAWWQKEAASALATSISRCKLGNGKRGGSGEKGDMWLLFTGPDRIGKKKMASVLSEQVGGGGNPVIICLGSRRDDDESDGNYFRGRTVLDRIVEAVRRNPFSVIMLEDIDEANMLVRGSIKCAMERGRLADSHGREISLGNIIFILTANSDSLNTPSLDENKLASIASGGWQLRLSISEKRAKRRANWLCDEDRTTKPRTELGLGLSFDLNEVADSLDDGTDGSHNSSDLTVDHEDEIGLENMRFSITSVPHELVTFLDDVIVFKPVNVRTTHCEIKNAITKKFFSVLDDRVSIEVQDEALERILGGVWLGRTSLADWGEKVLVPSFHQLKSRLPLSSSYENMVIRLEPDSNTVSNTDNRSSGNLLPSKITVMVDGV